MQNAHLSALETKHAAIDRRIANEMLRPMPNALLVTKLKREKLRVKEAIAST